MATIRLMEEPLDEISVPAEHVSDTALPLCGTSVQAGLPTPAEATEPEGRDVEGMLIGKPESTFFIRMKGDALRDYGVFDGDILVTDRSLAAGNGDLAVIRTPNGLFARAITVLDGRISFNPDKGLPEGGRPVLFGVITGIVRPLRNGKEG